MALSLTDIGVGTIAGDGTGDTARVAFQAVNSNNTAIENAVGAIEGRFWTIRNTTLDPLVMGARYLADNHAGIIFTLPAAFAVSATAYSDIWIANADNASSVTITPASGDALFVAGATLGVNTTYALTFGKVAMLIPRTTDSEWDVVLTSAGSGDFKADGSVDMTGEFRTDVGTFDSDVANGASAVAFSYDTANTYSTAGAKLASWKNNTTEKMYLDKDGDLYLRPDGTRAQLRFKVSGTDPLIDSPSGWLTIGIDASDEISVESGGVHLNGQNGLNAQRFYDNASIFSGYDASHLIVGGGRGSASDGISGYDDATHYPFIIRAVNCKANATTNPDGFDLQLTGGAGASASAGDADGGAVTITGGAGYGTGDGGNITLAGGTPGSGAKGIVDFSAGTKMQMDRTTQDAAFINFKATADGDATSAISTLTTSGATTHHIQIEINGVTAWIACSTTDPS